VSTLAVIRVVVVVVHSIRKLSFASSVSVVMDFVNGYVLGRVVAVVVGLWRAQILLYHVLGSIFGGRALCWHWMLSSWVVLCSQELQCSLQSSKGFQCWGYRKALIIGCGCHCHFHHHCCHYCFGGIVAAL